MGGRKRGVNDKRQGGLTSGRAQERTSEMSDKRKPTKSPSVKGAKGVKAGSVRKAAAPASVRAKKVIAAKVSAVSPSKLAQARGQGEARRAATAAPATGKITAAKVRRTRSRSTTPAERAEVVSPARESKAKIPESGVNRRKARPRLVKAVQAPGLGSSHLRRARFAVGDVVRHKYYPFRGVIFDIDPIFTNTEDWWLSIPEKMRPRKDQPFYHLLAENAETEYIAYVSEQNLVADTSGVPVRHPQVSEYFTEEENGRYRAVFMTMLN